jgi:hypothetical protein
MKKYCEVDYEQETLSQSVWNPATVTNLFPGKSETMFVCTTASTSDQAQHQACCGGLCCWIVSSRL